MDGENTTSNKIEAAPTNTQQPVGAVSNVSIEQLGALTLSVDNLSKRVDTQTQRLDSVKEYVDKVFDYSKASDKANETHINIISSKLNDNISEHKVFKVNINTLQRDVEIIKNKIKDVNGTQPPSPTVKEITTPDSSNSSKKDNQQSNQSIDKSTFTGLLLSVLPTIIKPTKKSTSKIDEKPQNVTVQSFSEQANTQLINNFKMAFQIKKQEETIKTKSSLMQLAVLAFVGLLALVFANLDSIKESFTSWLETSAQNWANFTNESKIGFTSITSSIMSWFAELGAAVISGMLTPVKEWFTTYYDKVTESITKWFNNFKNTISNMIPDSIKNIGADLKVAYNNVCKWVSKGFNRLIYNGWKKVKKWIFDLIGIDLFNTDERKVDISDDSDSVSDETGEDTEKESEKTLQSSGGSSAPSASPSKQDTPPPNTATINNNVANTANLKNVNSAKDSFENIHQLVNNGHTVLSFSKNKHIVLDKSDDIYIANKPDGVIHTIFKTIAANYNSIGTELLKYIQDISNGIEKSDAGLFKVLNELSKETKDDIVQEQITPLIHNIVNTAIQNNTPPKVISYNSVENMRNEYRQLWQ